MGKIMILIGLFVLNIACTGYSQDLPSAAKPVFQNGTYFYALKGKSVMNRFNIKSSSQLTVSVSNLPPGMSFNSSRNLIQGSVPAAGIYKYKVKASNSDGSDSLTITLDVRDSLLSPTPPMSWMTWNIFTCNYNEAVLRQIADAMVSSGMKNAGYNYLVIDDCWTASSRDANGYIQVDAGKFPSGMKALADYVHSKGLKLGIYSDAAPSTCGGYLGSYGNEQKDADKFAAWGIDFVKYDYCGAPSVTAEATKRYTAMRTAINKTNRPMLFNVCEWGQLTPWTWSPKIEGNMWRMTFDARDKWDDGPYSNSRCGVIQVLNIMPGLEYYSGPNAWNDPDMLAAGSSNMTLTEDQSQFSLFCLFSSPLTTSFDVRNMNQNTKNILFNTEAIAINQDILGQQASRIVTGSNYSIYAKDMADGSKAVGLLNLGTQTMNITVNWTDLFITGNHTVRDVWKKQDVGNSSTGFTTSVSSHQTVLLRIRPAAVAVEEHPGGPDSFYATIQNNILSYSYNLYRPQPVKLELIGASGAIISYLADSHPTTGTVQKELNCEDLAPGVYILRLSSESGVQAKKLVKY